MITARRSDEKSNARTVRKKDKTDREKEKKN